MTEICLYPDLTTWTPMPTELPPAWMALIDELAQESKGHLRHYIMDTRYDAQGVGDMLRDWGLPWPVVAAGYLWEHDEQKIYRGQLEGAELVVGHIKESISYVHLIEDEVLPPLLSPPYHDLGALLLAVVAYYRALHSLLAQNAGRAYTGSDRIHIERVGRTLLHLVKRLGMWYFKREIEDLKEQLFDPTNFAQDKREFQRILEQDAVKLEDVRHILTNEYQRVTDKPIVVSYTPCGIAGLKRRIQDAHTTATSQKTQLTGFDLVTFDIAVPTVKACYMVLGVLSQLGHVQDRVTDQVAHPKPNGYSHIALGLILDAQAPELQPYAWLQERKCTCFIQIATPLMQAIMRYGCLYPECYRLYLREEQTKLALPSAENYWKSSEGRVFATIKQSFAADRQPEMKAPIIVYDKSRKAVALPVGATALDFAYAIDISIGERAVEAFVNNRKAPLFRMLDTSDIVEIRTSNETQAQEYWLEESYVVTPLAKRHIRKLLDQRLLEHRGYTLLSEALDQYHYKLTPEELDEELRHLVKEFDLGTRQSYLEQLTPEGAERYTPAWAAQKIIEQLVERKVTPASEEHSWVPMLLSSESTAVVPQSLCGVCRPVYPRDRKIVGHRRRNGELVVHSIHCPRLASHVVSAEATFEPMTWQYLPPACKASFIIEALGQRELIHDILRQLRRHQGTILSLRADVVSRLKKSSLHLTIEAQDEKELLNIWYDLERVEGVQRVRVDSAATLPSMSERLNKQHEHGATPNEQIGRESAWEKTLAALAPRYPILVSPFDISRPATARMFFGRSGEMKKMQRDLCDGENGKALVLYGPRRSGKSSLCKNFLERHVHAPFWHVFCSLQGMGQQNEVVVLAHIAHEVQRAFTEQLHKTVPGWEEYGESDPEIRFKQLLRACQERAPMARLVLILDEFGGALNAYQNHVLEKRFFTFWRDVMSDYPQLSLMLVLPTSAHTLLTTTDLSHAFTFAEALPLAFLDQRSAEQLLIDPLREQEVAIHPGTAARATALAGGNPYYLALIGIQLIQQLNDEPRKQYILDKDLLLAVDHLIEADSVQNFTFYRQELQCNEELRLLEAIVELTGRANLPSVSLKKIATWLGLSESEIRPHLERLRTGLILDEYRRERSSANPYYSFKIELLQRWMTRNRWFFLVWKPIR